MRPFSVSTPRKRKDGKTFWLTIGAAWPRDDGGMMVKLDANPLPDAEGNATLLISPPRDDNRSQAGSANTRAQDDLDSDAIPL